MFPLPAGPEVILTSAVTKQQRDKQNQSIINCTSTCSSSSVSARSAPAWVQVGSRSGNNPPPGSSSSPRLFLCSSLPLIKLATKCPGHRLPRPRKEPWRREDVGARLCVVAPVVVPEDPRLPACTHKHTRREIAEPLISAEPPGFLHQRAHDA